MECGARSWTSGCHQIATIRLPQEDRREYSGLRQETALLVVDRYNDFISEGGKIWPRIKAVAEANNCVAHMLEVLNAARRAKLRVFYAMHHRYRPGDYETWKYIAPVQKGTWQHGSFEFGTWGGEFRAEFVPAPGEIVAQEHSPAASPTPTLICN
jgi:nicotinamidase-related amidase